MKRILLLGLMLVLVSQSFSQSWRRVGSWGNNYSDIKWINNEVGYICGENIFLKSIDGGLSWIELPTPVTGLVVAMDFFDERNGILLAGQGQLYRTSNGGLNWQRTQLPGQENLKDVHYINAANVWISGENGSLFFSTNGGQTWLQRELNTSADLNALYFLNTQLGYIATSNSEVLKTTNGGSSWEKLSTGYEVSLNAIYFVSDTTGYAVGDLGTIIKTEDGGDSWLFINSGIDTDFTDVSFHRNTPLIGIISGKRGTMLRTVNGGLTFIQVNSRTVQDIKAVDFRQETNNAFAVSNSGFLTASSNSGSSWAIRMSGRAANFTAVQFTSHLRGYVTGESGLVLLTGNGGNSYTDRSRNLSASFKAIHFVTAAAGYVSGENGNMISTTNSGANWTTLNLGTNRSLNGIYFFDINRGFVVGEKGFLASTENRGVNWAILNSGETETDFRAISFFEATEGLIIGDRGYISRTEDGNTWTRVSIPSNANLNAIKILDENSAMVVGDQGTIFKTSDRGRQWQRISTGFQENFTDIEFLDESVGFITGKKGLMIRTFDRGETWERLNTGTYQDLNGLSFGDLNVGYAVGQNGLLFQYTCQVPQQPTAIFGETDICLSQQVYTIQQGEEPGTTYEWRVDGGTLVEGQGTNRIVIRWDVAGRNAVMVRGQNTCGNGLTSALEVVVSKQPSEAPPIQGEGVVCLGSTEEFQVDSIAGTEYIWQVTGGIIRGGQGTSSVAVEWTTLGNHTLKVSTTNPCGQGPTSQKPIRVSTIPNRPGAIAGSSTVGFQEVDYEIPAVQDLNYQWTLAGGGNILSGQGTNRVRVRWEEDGNYTLTVTPLNNCDEGPSQSIDVHVSFITSFEEETHSASFGIYPNPSQGDVTVSTRGIPDVREISVFNNLGQLVRQYQVDLITTQLQLKDLPKGVLYVVLKTRNKEYKETIWVR